MIQGQSTGSIGNREAPAIANRAIFSLSADQRAMPVTLNRPPPVCTLIVFSTLLAACATTAPQPSTTSTTTAAAAGRDGARQQLSVKLASGVYRCDENQRVEIQRDPRRTNQITLNWQGRRHTLQRYDSESGLPRYEDRQNGLVWIDLPWKSVLMDSENGRPLANECKAARG